MASKYIDPIFNLLVKEEMKSTFTILQELQEKVNKTISWTLVYAVLRDLEHDGKAEKIKTKHSLFWRKK